MKNWFFKISIIILGGLLSSCCNNNENSSNNNEPFPDTYFNFPVKEI